MLSGPATPLILRPWRPGDEAAALKAFADPEMARQGGPMADAAEAARWVESMSWKTSREHGFVFAAVTPRDVPIATVAATNVDRHDCGWVWYWTTAEARGGGVASDALAALTPWLHDEAGLFRLELGHRVNNPASGRVAARAGFAPEGLQRSKLHYDGTRFDVQRHARLTTDPRPAPRRKVKIVPAR
ncbi:MAG: GNAT family N-acetyltransferase [Stackebrandtia sp.]